MTEAQKRAQQKYRAKPEVRKRYLADARRRSREWNENPENKLRRYKYNQASWLRQVKRLEEKAERPRPKKCEIGSQEDTICF